MRPSCKHWANESSSCPRTCRRSGQELQLPKPRLEQNHQTKRPEFELLSICHRCSRERLIALLGGQGFWHCVGALVALHGEPWDTSGMAGVGPSSRIWNCHSRCTSGTPGEILREEIVTDQALAGSHHKLAIKDFKNL
jgi:hypothetical protein